MLEVVRGERPSVIDSERGFPSLCFALATRASKTSPVRVPGTPHPQQSNIDPPPAAQLSGGGMPVRMPNQLRDGSPSITTHIGRLHPRPP